MIICIMPSNRHMTEILSDSSANANNVSENGITADDFVSKGNFMTSTHKTDSVTELSNPVPTLKLLSVNDQRKKYMTRGLSGLVNLANTCYMNAALQCLVATDVFVGYLKQGTYKNDLKHGIIRTLASEKRKKAKENNEPETTIKLKVKNIRENFKNKYKNHKDVKEV